MYSAKGIKQTGLLHITGNGNVSNRHFYTTTMAYLVYIPNISTIIHNCDFYNYFKISSAWSHYKAAIFLINTHKTPHGLTYKSEVCRVFGEFD